MLHRHAISDADWNRIKDILPGRPGQTGWVAKDNRLFVDAVLWIARTGAPWRDLPERFGNWNSAWRRFDRWATKGTWRLVFDALQDPDKVTALPSLRLTFTKVFCGCLTDSLSQTIRFQPGKRWITIANQARFVG